MGMSGLLLGWSLSRFEVLRFNTSSCGVRIGVGGRYHTSSATIADVFTNALFLFDSNLCVHQLADRSFTNVQIGNSLRRADDILSEDKSKGLDRGNPDSDL